MKTFEELQECVRNIIKMEEIFNSVVVLACHKKEIEQFINLKDRVLKLLVKDVHQNTYV